jgi:hypothetical protein
MRVSEVKGETRAEANHVYVIPPRCNLGISDGVLQTPPRPGQWPQHADRLFFPRPGGGPRQPSARRGSVGNRIGWDAGPPGDQGRGRCHLRPGMRTAKFDGMPEAPSPPVWWILSCRRPESRGNWSPSRGIPMSGRSRRGAEPPGMRNWPRYSGWCERHRSGLHALQAQHPGAAHQAAHGPSADSSSWKTTAGISSRTARKPTRCARAVLSPSLHSFGNRRSSRR